MSELQKQFDWYRAHQTELVKNFDGRWIVVVREQVAGDFESELAAYEFAQPQFTAGEFLIQLVTTGDQSYSQTFHSRVSF
jgi:hypothetical protein